MSRLTSGERKHLRGLAHSLEPLVRIGKAGLGEPQLTQIDQALADHELIKVRFLAGKPDPAEVTTLEERLACDTAGAIGHVLILYRQQPDPQKRRVRLA